MALAGAAVKVMPKVIRVTMMDRCMRCSGIKWVMISAYAVVSKNRRPICHLTRSPWNMQAAQHDEV